MRSYGYDQVVKAPHIGKVMTRPAGIRARTELRVYRISGGIDRLPAEDIEAAKAQGRELYVRDADVFRVDLLDPLRATDIWSTDDELDALTLLRA